MSDIAQRPKHDKPSRDDKLYRKMQGEVEESVATMFRSASEQAQLIRRMVDAAVMAGRHAEILQAQETIPDTVGLLRSVELFLTEAHAVKNLYRNYKALAAPDEKP
jgi:phage-related minor tail protein